MSKKTPKSTPELHNRKARHDYHIEKTLEAGIVLQGTEVKSIRAGEASLVDSFAEIRDEEVWLRGMYIKPYSHGSYHNHEERRDRKLLLHRREIRELDKGVTRKGFTIVPLKAYFKEGKVKIQVGLARGKKTYDKREAIREKDERREMDRRLKAGSRA